MKKRILIVSYYANMPGACQAEWVDDKIKSLLTKDYLITVVSSICANLYQMPGIFHCRVPSLSLYDFKDEWERIKAGGIKFSWVHSFLLPFIFTFGFLFDRLQYILTKGIGEGRWSWTLPSFIAILVASIKDCPAIIISTGGPASAHVSSLIVGKILRKPVIVELQDPLSGDDIGRNSSARGWLYKVEKFIVNNAEKTVYVTKGAADFAKNQFQSTKIEAVYPGAWDYKISSADVSKSMPRKIKLIHLGSLYATRNFKSIIAAIELLISSGEIAESEVELLNLGHVSPEISVEILQKPYVKILPPVGRREALEIASGYDVMLLIQNQDKRSQVTIPFKTYDYLNLNNKVLGILNSKELTSLLKEHGQMAFNLDDIEGVADGLRQLLSMDKLTHGHAGNIDSIIQAEKLINLPS